MPRNFQKRTLFVTKPSTAEWILKSQSLVSLLCKPPRHSIFLGSPRDSTQGAKNDQTPAADKHVRNFDEKIVQIESNSGPSTFQQRKKPSIHASIQLMEFVNEEFIMERNSLDFLSQSESEQAGTNRTSV